MKWLKIMSASICALFLVVGVGTYASFATWRSNHQERLEEISTVKTTELGPVEFAERGHGEPVLLLHGTPGGYDQVLAGPSLFADEYRQIIVSRPGYLRTPLSSGKTPEEQADLFAELLNMLGVERNVVAGVSGGGPAAIQYALRYPDRTSALILLSARTRSHPVDDDDDPPSMTDRIREIFGTDFLVWLLQDRIAASFATAAPEELSDESKHALKQVVLSAVPEDLRVDGRKNDTQMLTDRRIDTWPLSDISVPVLIIYGADDSGVSPQESVYAHGKIANSRLIKLQGGHFIGVTHAQAVQAVMQTFLDDLNI